MRILVNYLPHFGKTTDADLAMLQHLGRIGEHIPIDIVFNKSVIQPQILRFGRRLQTTRFARWAKAIPQYSVVIPPWQARGFNLVYSFHIAPFYFPGFSHPPNVMHRHWITDRYIRHQGIVDLGKFRKGIISNDLPGDISITSTKSSVPLFKEMLAGIVKDVYYSPFFLPDIVPIDLLRLDAKQGQEVVRLLFVGADGGRKGIHVLTAALGILTPSVARRLHVDVVTSTPVDIAHLRCKSVVVHRRLPHADVMRLMAQANVFCMPTLHDTYGLVFLEAMSQGCAIISDDDLPRIEMIRDSGCGVCVDPAAGDAPARVAAAIAHMVEDESARENCSRKARETFVREYAAEAVAVRLQMIFKKIVEQRASGR